jgi:hypothetical protein
MEPAAIEVREKRLEFLRSEHPESLPCSRNETVGPTVADAREREAGPPRRAAAVR